MDFENKAVDEGVDHMSTDEAPASATVEANAAMEDSAGAAPSVDAQGAGADSSADAEGSVVDIPPHSLMSVLRPANPPQPKNARIVRLFDLEAAKYDPQPGQPPAAPQPQKPKPEARDREAARAARNQSLLAAAGLT